MKQKVTKVVALVCALTCMSMTLVSCRPGSGILGGQNVINKNKTQLYVGNYDGGFGHKWLDEYKAGFEEKYKGVSFEEGKTGVEVVILNDKVSYFSQNLISTMDQSNIDLVFTEETAYYDFISRTAGNLLYDMTSWVTEKLPGEDRSIEDKLNAQQKEYYTGYDKKYYGLPHYQSFRGLIYDVDLFNAKSLFIKADGSISGKSTDIDLANGPDGKANTYDDGLPATYDELWRWCEYVTQPSINVTPFCWTGAYMEAYSKYLEDALLVDTLGLEAGQFYFSQSKGEVEVDLIKSFDGNGNPVITRESISRENSYDMCMAAAGYYMLDFWKHILDNGWYYDMSLNSLTTHDVIHYDYLRSSLNDTDDLKSIAFIIEGAWWENESDYIFEELDARYPDKKASRTERTFGYMPLPKARAEYAGEMTLLDANNSIMIVNANIKGKPEEDIAKKFVQYISSDANIQKFTTTTGIPRDYNVDLTDAQLKTLSPYCQQLWTIRQNAKGVVYARKGNYEIQKHNTLNSTGVDFRTAVSLDGATWYGMPLSVFTTDETKNMTAKEYFDCVYNKYL